MRVEELANKACVPCKGTSPLAGPQADRILQDLPGWTRLNDTIEKEFRFKSYRAALDFAYSVGKIAEEQDHHPDMLVKWRTVRLTFSTHAIRGLSMNDFIMAAKSESEFRKGNLPRQTENLRATF